MKKLSKVSTISVIMVLSTAALLSCGKGHEHTYELHEEVAGTCVAHGRAAYYSCSGCELIFDSEKVETTMDALETPYGSHQLSHHDAKLPECEVAGNIEYWSCNLCEKLFSDSQAKNQITDPSVTKGHAYGSWIDEVPASCVATGLRGHYHCADCDKYFDSSKNEVTRDSLIIPLGEHVSDGVWGSDENNHWTTCTVCEEHISEAHSHKYVLSSDSSKYEWKCVCGHKGAGHDDILASTGDVQGLTQYNWDSENSKFVANEAAQINLPALPAGTALKSVKVGGVAVEGATLDGSVLSLPVSVLSEDVGTEKTVEAIITVEGQDLKVSAYYKAVTAEVASMQQFSFVRWTSEANNGSTKSSGDHPFVKYEGENAYIDGYFVMTEDFHVGGGTINEKDGDFGYAGNVANSGWNSLKGFRGTFDGQGHCFDDITFISYGLFGAIGKGGVVKNFNITCTNGYSTVIHQAQPYACSIASQVYTATIENVEAAFYSNSHMVSEGTWNAVFVGDMLDANSTVRNCHIKIRRGTNNVFGTRTTGSVTFENVTVEVFKQWSSDEVFGITRFYGGHSDSYPECKDAPAGVTLVMPA